MLFLHSMLYKHKFVKLSSLSICKPVFEYLGRRFRDLGTSSCNCCNTIPLRKLMIVTLFPLQFVQSILIPSKEEEETRFFLFLFFFVKIMIMQMLQYFSLRRCTYTMSNSCRACWFIPSFQRRCRSTIFLLGYDYVSAVTEFPQNMHFLDNHIVQIW